MIDAYRLTIDAYIAPTLAEISLDAPIDRSDREASTLGERFAGVDGTEIEDTTDYKLMKEFIERVFRKYLTPRERKILFLYYGLDESGEPIPYDELPLVVAVRNDRPAHADFEIRSADGARHQVEVSAFPIQTAHGSRGAIAILWPAAGDEAGA